jgi:molybdate transport system substrate-binding protein
VRAVLTKVIADEADAGIVYRTDVAAAGGQVEGIAIPDDINVVNEYAIALTADAQEGSQAFVDFVLSDQGQQILRTWGFTPP